MSAEPQKYVQRIRIELLGMEPPIWRRILVPDDCSFWDLHVAIQDAMGWSDSHLHVFRFLGSETALGIPEEDGEGPFKVAPEWEHQVGNMLSWHAPLATYEYDLGDSWLHEVRWEGAEPAKPDVSYPQCVDGARRCPPEDVGGIPGYEDFLHAVSDPSHTEHESMLEWVGGTFDAERFDAAAVRFSDPVERWREVFEGAED